MVGGCSGAGEGAHDIVPAMYFDLPCKCPWQTLELDMAVEAFFLFELVLAFKVGVYTSDGKYIQSNSGIAGLYFKSGRFFFDLLTAAPITWIEYIVVFAPGCDESSQSFAYIKAPLRCVERKSVGPALWVNPRGES
jgi:hypothetical protein